MKHYYTDEPHAQIVLALFKAHGIKKIVVSPGATNIPIAASVQFDRYFEVYSCVDERSAAYMACGLAEESNETVVLSCTGATASRNYMPGLTEAFYRKLPIIALTSFNGNKFIGNLMPQNLDRTVIPKDVAKISVQLPVVKDKSDFDLCSLLVNKAILEAVRNGGGPVHINLTTTYKGTFQTKELPKVKVIHRLDYFDKLPNFNGKKIAIFVGAHKKFTKSETSAIECFCKRRDAVVLCDHSSGYKGKYRIQSALVCSNFRKLNSDWSLIRPEVVIHLGEVSGDYPSSRVLEEANEVWRVSEDGEIRDRGGNLHLVYQGTELSFFEKLGLGNEENNLWRLWYEMDAKLRKKIPELPFSNVWIASQLSRKLPDGSYLHLAILNSLRSWNLFNISPSIFCSANVGGFGIDGCLSTLIGSSLVKSDKLYFGVIGDLAFFYDINVIANRHIDKNIRILLINNGCGAEFNVSTHVGSKFGERSNEFIAAAGHFASGEGNTSKIKPSVERSKLSIAKSWADSLGFRYMSSISKDGFDILLDEFVDKSSDVPIIFECFTDSEKESDALENMSLIDPSAKEKLIEKAKVILPSKITNAAKFAMKKI
jgi:2-succinyl-5-enolpyruvyl-6-hydroxy-3-cyclohexene-1-carboxylate synthase